MTSLEVVSVPESSVWSAPVPVVEAVSSGVLSHAATPSANRSGKISLSRIRTLSFIIRWRRDRRYPVHTHLDSYRSPNANARRNA